MPDNFNEPMLRKKMPIALDIGEFKNGDETGVLDATVIQEMFQNYSFNPKVPVYLWNHVDNLDDQLPDGWVEGLSIDAGGQLIGDVKVMGEAARLILADKIRGLSPAWRPKAKDYAGKSIGAMLMHVTLTNEGYLKTLPNIAAARSNSAEPLTHCFIEIATSHEQGGERVDYYATALYTETPMPDKDKIKDSPPDKDKQRVDPNAEELTVASLKAKDDEIVTLKAKLLQAEEAIEDLKDQIAKAPMDEEKEELALKVKRLEMKSEAQEIRELVFSGLQSGRLKPSWCGGYNDGKGADRDKTTVAWLKNHPKFQGDLKLLRWATENNEPMYRVGRTFVSGVPVEKAEIALTEDAKRAIKAMNLDPEKVQASMQTSDPTELKGIVAGKEA